MLAVATLIMEQPVVFGFSWVRFYSCRAAGAGKRQLPWRQAQCSNQRQRCALDRLWSRMKRSRKVDRGESRRRIPGSFPQQERHSRAPKTGAPARKGTLPSGNEAVFRGSVQHLWMVFPRSGTSGRPGGLDRQPKRKRKKPFVSQTDRTG
jgi:hypothetical protein